MILSVSLTVMIDSNLVKSRCNNTLVMYTHQDKIPLHKNLITLTHCLPTAEANLFPVVLLCPQINDSTLS